MPFADQQAEPALVSFEVGLIQIVFWPTAIFIVARGNAPGIENGTNRFGQRPYSNQSTRIEYGRWPKKLRVFRIPGALPQAVLNEALGHKSKHATSKLVSQVVCIRNASLLTMSAFPFADFDTVHSTRVKPLPPSPVSSFGRNSGIRHQSAVSRDHSSRIVLLKLHVAACHG